nr:PKS I [Verrucosispora sp.]
MHEQEKVVDYLKRVTADLQRTRNRLRELEEKRDEPLAIIGMSCRLPGGATSPEALWQLLLDGRDAIVPFPSDRGWNLGALHDPDADHPGTTYVRGGGFLDDIAGFDAAFFGINPREALAMDPQQRLLLEAGWTAVESAGLRPPALRGSRTGVFVGIGGPEYATLVAGDGGGLEGYAVTGNAASVASGRLAYTMGFEGPAVTVDTACSSSLVALHLAGDALRKGECTLALVGGAMVHAATDGIIAFSRQRGLAADGRCKAFSDSADGFGMSEGVAMLLVERLSDARRNNHKILALVRGSAVNQDGASSGLTAPNGPSQQRVIRAALANAGLSVRDVDAVEAHGTGTALGDPIEAQALLATYGQERGEAGPVWLGSLKSNIGHTQAAAGVAGVIKMVQAMRHGVLPRTLHVDEPSSKVDWAAGAVALLTEARDWSEAADRPRRAAVSSFGVSGTNAHVILEAAPAAEPVESAPAPPMVPFVISGRSATALRGQAVRLNDTPLTDPLRDVAHSLFHHRVAFEHRAVVAAGEPDRLRAALDALAVGDPTAGLVEGAATGAVRRVALVFPGQGSQWVGMASELLAQSAVFRDRFGECERALAPFVDWRLSEVIGDETALGRVDVVQPVLWAVMVSLAEVWSSFGVKPSVVVGHSQGEVAAACVAGLLSLDDGARIVASRSALVASKLAGRGGMVSVSASREEVESWLVGLSVAAVNGPSSLVVAGDDRLLDALLARCEQAGVRARRIAVDYASHSVDVETIEADLRAALAGIVPTVGGVPFFSTVTGRFESVVDADYWYRNLRQPVGFAAAVQVLVADGVDAFVEVSAHPVLTTAIEDTVEDAAVVVGTLRRDEGGLQRLYLSLGEAWTRGLPVDFTPAFGNNPQLVDLPTYAFQRERFWLDPTPTHGGDPAMLGLTAAGHPLLGAAVPLADGDGVVLTGRIGLHTHPWLADHAVNGTVLLPGTAFVDLALRAGDEAGCGMLTELTLHAPLTVTPRTGVEVQVRVTVPDDSGARTVTIHSRDDDDDDVWTMHASGSLTATPSLPAAAPMAWPPAGATALDLDGFYDRLAADGYDYGPVFRGLRAVWRRGDEIFAEAGLPEPAHADGFGVHPALLDAALHAMLAIGDGEVRLPFAWTGVTLHATGATVLRVRLSPAGSGTAIHATDAAGHPVFTADALVSRPVTPATSATGPDSLFQVNWVRSPALDAPAPRIAVLGDDTLGLHASGVVPTAYAGLGTVTDVPDILAVCRAGTGTLDPAAVRASTAGLLDVLQEWLSDERFAATRLAIVTRGAMSCGDDAPGTDPSLAPLWGLVRSAQSEHPGRIVLADLDPGRTADDTPLPAALASAEPQIALRDGALLVPRLVRAGQARGLVPPVDADWRLEVTAPGTLENLVLAPQPARAVRTGEIRVAVHAAGLNFRDVMISLGMYPDAAAATMGGEGAGVVVEVGPGVTGLSVGDRVLGLMPGGLGPSVVVDHRLVVPIPPGMSFTVAASIPVVFLTAYYALVDVAGVRVGERVLVHAAAGGVGMAAVRLAGVLGAEVVATARPDKWSVVGVAGVCSSRSLEFASVFSGVDVVVNSLAGEFVDASLGLLGNGGRFVELGKTDVRDPSVVAAAHPGVTYRAFDLVEAAPERIGEMLRDIVRMITDGVLRPLPVTAWDIRRAPDAFRHLAQARHVGKLVLSIPRPLDPDGTVLITGGTGGLGRLLARHLVRRHGVRHLLLAARRGAATPGVTELTAELAADGADVRVVACDVTDRAEVVRLLSAVAPEHPLTAVVHTAGVLDDGLVTSLDHARLDTVMRPKADAAWHLHELTAPLGLARFVLFSAASGTLGGPGQGNYAAANVFLDSLAEFRRSQGLPAVSLAWGLWAERSGMTGHLDDADLARMARGGIAALTAEEGLALFDAAFEADTAQLVPLRLDLRALRARPYEDLPAVLRGLVRTPARRVAAVDGPADRDSLTARLAALSAPERRNHLRDLVRAHAATVLGHTADTAIDPGRAFKDLGFDSLTGVELRNRLGAATGVRLTATLVFDYPTPEALAEHLDATLFGTAAAAAGPAVVRATADAGEPIAIVGMSCRLPGGVDSPDALWRLLYDGADATSEFPTDRGWDHASLFDPDPGHAGTSYSSRGGFVQAADRFDAGFFGISPREALAMDPQQRLLLETSWEAFEAAGLDPATLRGSRTAVMVGASRQDYATLQAGTPEEIEGYLVTGNAASVVSGRLSYTFGLEGPAVTVDTACSSSLVALHLAAQALRQGECDLALAGGVTIMSTPGIFVEFSRQRGLAADGRCKAFSASADGFGMSEGVGMLLLERLSDARRNNHRILALVRGSAVNQDGASNGLTAPNGPSQERVIRAALASAGLSTADVDAVEAHGTGTTLGDPIEAQALLATYGRERGEAGPVWLGSVKSNIGHTQAAAGVAGVIKMVLAMRYERLPRTLHADEPSPHVDWSAGDLRLLTEPRDWSGNGHPRRAGVSSFGVSGTNAHVILEEAPDSGTAPERTGDPYPMLPFVLSGRDGTAVRAQAHRLSAHLGLSVPPSVDVLRDVAHSLFHHRVAFEHRAVVAAGEPDRLRAALDALAVGDPTAGLVEGAATGAVRRVALVFPGQGSQWVGMASELLAQSAVFRDRFGECERALAPFVDWRLSEVIGDETALGRVDVVQPVLWAVMVSLAEVWSSFGVKPSVVVGHSQGEVAAACVAGLLSLDDGARIVASRSALVASKLAGRGGMVSVSASREEVESWLVGLSVAAVNGPSSLVVAGDDRLLDALLARCEQAGVRARRIAVDYASHSVDVETIEADLRAALAGIVPTVGGVPFFSTVTGRFESVVDADYWYRNLRQPVGFAAAVQVLVADGVDAFVEVSAHPVLTTAIEDTVEDAAVVVGTLRRDEGGLQRLYLSLGEAWTRGLPVDFTPAFGNNPQLVDLPTYAFQRERFWLDPTPTHGGDPAMLGLTAAGHPLLGAAVPLADGDGVVLTGRIGLHTHPWLADHTVLGSVLLPGTGFVELALRAGDEAGCGVLDELTLQAPLVIPAHGAVHVQVRVAAADQDGTRAVTIHSRDGDAPWATHATGLLTAAPSRPGTAAPMAWPPAGATALDLDGFYDRLAADGYDYGPVFRGLRAAWRHGEELFAEIGLPDPADTTGFGVHPALLDAALHAMLAVGDGEVRLPFAWTGVSLHATGATVLRVRLSPARSGTAIHAIDAAGHPVFTADALVSRPVDPAALASATTRQAQASLFRVGWEAAATTEARPARTALLGADVFGLLPAGVASTGYQDLAEMTDFPEVVAVCSGTDPATPEAVHAATTSLLLLLQRWLADDRLADTRLAVVTRGAVAATEHDDVPDLAHAALWGLVRSAQTEHPGRFLLIDLDPDAGLAADLLTAALSGAAPQTALRGDALLTPRLVPQPMARAELPAIADGTVLITGGTGGLGAQLARHLVIRYGAGRLLLASRAGADAPGADALRAELATLGAEAEIVACDIADPDDVARLLERIPAEHPLTGVVHAAGALDDGMLTSLSTDRVEAVLRPKVDGALHLHRLTAAAKPALFALFSSAAGVLGSAGQANYAAANAFLDALAAHRRATGLPATSLAWGLWEQSSGMTDRLDAQDRRRMSRSGLTPLSTEDGLALFDLAIAGPAPAVVPIRLDPAEDADADAPMLRGLVRAPRRRAARNTVTADGFRDRLAAMPEGQRAAAVLTLVRTHAAAVLGHNGPGAVDPRRGFQQSGFDSLTAVDLRNRLGAAVGIRLPATLIFDYPSPAVLAEHLTARLTATMTATPAPAAAPEPIRPGALLAELDRLESALAGARPDDEDSARIGARLHRLAAAWSGRPEPAPAGAAVTDRLKAASADEIFAFIQNELGKS